MSPNYFKHTPTYNHTIESVRVRELYHFQINVLKEPIKGRLKVDVMSQSPHPHQRLENKENQENVFGRVWK